MVMTLEDLESLEETLEMLSRSELTAEIREAEAEVADVPDHAADEDEALRIITGR